MLADLRRRAVRPVAEVDTDAEPQRRTPAPEPVPVGAGVGAGLVGALSGAEEEGAG
jgi:hypothetical protein